MQKKEKNNKMKKIRGTVLAVNISQKKGEKKHNIGCGLLLVNHGLKNDAHVGSWIRQVSLLARESIEKIRAKGLDVQYGDFAEKSYHRRYISTVSSHRHKTQSGKGSPSGSHTNRQGLP